MRSEIGLLTPLNGFKLKPLIRLISGLEKLDLGEREEILLAEQMNAELVILDDKAARRIARERALKIIKILGILKDAGKAGLVDLQATFKRLQEVGFWVAPSLLKQLLRED